jgi:hypothetical protein
MALFDGGAEEANREYQKYQQQALDEMRRSEAQGRGDITGYTGQAIGYGEPYRQAGEEALGAYEGTLGLTGGRGQQAALDRFKASPGYQYAVNQAMQGVRRRAAASGMGGSGAEQAELQRRAEGLASQEYGQYQGRLANLAGSGQQAAGQAAQLAYGTGGTLANLGRGYSAQEAGTLGQMGQSAAEAKMAESSGLGGALGTLGGVFLGPAASKIGKTIASYV